MKRKISEKMKPPRIYIDMDNVIVDFPSAIRQLSKEVQATYAGRLDDVPGIFALMSPMPGAIESVAALAKAYDVYVLSTAPWDNPSAWSDKLLWIKKHFGADAGSTLYKRLILSHHKNLNRGDYLIDDRDKNGSAEFEGELIKFGSEQFPNWKPVTDYLLQKRKLET